MILAAFEEKFIPEPNSGCWIWTASTFKNGYGQFRRRDQTWGALAHRASWLFYRGSLPDDLQILHKCDNRLCVNPDHLYAGTHKQNMRDMIVRNRHRSNAPKAEDHYAARLTWREIKEIRQSGKTIAQLARDYGMSHGGMSGIIHKRKWKEHN